jgi:acetylornithine deacetylase
MDASITAEIDILRTLVGFDTTSRRSNLELIDWVEQFAVRRGARVTRVSSADGTKANLLAVIGPPVAGGIVLSGHTDVVPVDGQPWTSDPWTLTKREGRLYGRGAADMKGFLALLLSALDPGLDEVLKRPLVLAFSYDEEIGCFGAPGLIAELRRTLPAPAAVIIGEPTLMHVVSAHKGIRLFEVEVTGKEAHSSSRGIGTSAIMAAVELMALVDQLNREAAANHRGPSLFDPPGTTMTVGLVQGGTAANILARRCCFSWDLRAECEADADRFECQFVAAAEQLTARLREVSPTCGVQVSRKASVPALEADPSSRAEAVARALTGDRGLMGVPFVAEAGLFSRAGLPAVLCGPGSIDQAHQPDEWIAMEQLVAGRQFVRAVIQELST